MGNQRLVASLVFFFLCTTVEAQRSSNSVETNRIITGEVVLENGEYPKDPVLVELICFGKVSRQAEAQVGGIFTIEFGTQRPTELMDSSEARRGSGGEFYQRNRIGASGRASGAFSRAVQGNLDLSGCIVQGNLRGFRSTFITLGRRRPMDDPSVGTIVLHPLEGTEHATIDLESLQVPEGAKKSLEEAQKELRKEKVNYSRATRELEKAVKIAPDLTVGWQLLGEVRLLRKDEVRARKAFGKAMEIDPEYISPYLSLARLELKERRWAEVERLSQAVIELNPHMSYAQYLCAVASYSLGKLDVAENLVKKVHDSGAAERYPETYFILGGILAQRGEISLAAGQFTSFLATGPKGALAERSRQILAGWEEEGLLAKQVPTVSDN